MARVRVRVYAKLREQLGFKEKTVEVDTLSELIRDLGVSNIVIAVNSELVETSKASRLRLVDGDIIDLMPPFSGG